MDEQEIAVIAEDFNREELYAIELADGSFALDRAGEPLMVSLNGSPRASAKLAPMRIEVEA